MPNENNINRYDSVSIFLHWGLALMVIVSITCIELHEMFPKGSVQHDGLKDIHGQLGFLLFFLTLLKLGWRLGNPVPPITPTPQLWVLAARNVAHVAIYATLLTLAILGMSMGNFFLSQDKELAHTLKVIHETLGNFLIVLIAIHVAATLWHQWVRRDDTLRRMLPGRRA